MREQHPDGRHMWGLSRSMIVGILGLAIAALLPWVPSSAQQRSASPPDDSVVFLGSDDLSGDLVAFGSYALDEPGIYYSPLLREITIRGMENAENHAVVELVAPNVPVVGVGSSVRVTLNMGSAASGETIIFETPYGWPYEAQPESAGETRAAGPSEQGATDQQWQLVTKVRFFGGDQIDVFENLTGIRSFAEAGDGADELIGGSSRDIFKGGPGDDTLRGNEGADTLEVGPGDDRAFGGPGDDVLEASGAHGGVAETNALCGGDGADILTGDPNARNRLDSELAGGVSDGDVDQLHGFSGAAGPTEFEFSPGDLIFVEYRHLERVPSWFPVSDIACP